MSMNPGDRSNVISAGRGRGLRPRVSEDLLAAVETQLRLPKTNPQQQARKSEAEDNFAEILSTIKQLDSSKANPADIEKLSRMVSQTVLTESALKDLVLRVHKQSIQNPWFGKNAVHFFNSVSSFEVHGVKLRNVLLNSLKEEFEAREKVREQSVESFLNALEFMGHIFHSLRLANGQPIKLLAVALVKYMETLVSYPIGNSETRTLFKQMILNGKELDEQDSAGVERLLITIRRCLVEEKLNPGVKYKLLAIIELATGHWRVPKQATVDFYNENDVEFDL